MQLQCPYSIFDSDKSQSYQEDDGIKALLSFSSLCLLLFYGETFVLFDKEMPKVVDHCCTFDLD